MFDNVTRHERDTLVRADHRFQPRPFGLELLFDLDLFAFGHFFKLGVNPGALVFAQFEFGEPAFVINADGRAILHCTLDVIDVNVIAKDGGRAAIRRLDGCARKADE